MSLRRFRCGSVAAMLIKARSRNWNPRREIENEEKRFGFAVIAIDLAAQSRGPSQKTRHVSSQRNARSKLDRGSEVVRSLKRQTTTAARPHRDGPELRSASRGRAHQRGARESRTRAFRSVAAVRSRRGSHHESFFKEWSIGWLGTRRRATQHRQCAR